MMVKSLVTARHHTIVSLLASCRPMSMRCTACPVSTFHTLIASIEPVMIRSPEASHEMQRMRPVNRINIKSNKKFPTIQHNTCHVQCCATITMALRRQIQRTLQWQKLLQKSERIHLQHNTSLTWIFGESFQRSSSFSTQDWLFLTSVGADLLPSTGFKMIFLIKWSTGGISNRN